MTKQNFFRTIIFVCFFMNLPGIAPVFTYAQEKPPAIKVNGSASLSSNFYNAEGITPRQPENLQMAILRANVSLYGVIDLPFELYYSTGQTRFQQPFNQFGVSPKISNWLTLHAGYFSTQFSGLTFGDLRLLGGGIELTPGNFRLRAAYGRTRQAVEPNRVSYRPEVYRQTAYAASIGFGDPAKSYFNINLFHALDDSTSVQSDSLLVSPNENLVGSFDFGLALGSKVSMKGEVGFSAFSSDLRSESIEIVSLPVWLYTPNTSTRIDGAARFDLNLIPSRYWSLMLSSRWIGPGYTTLGYALMPNDLLEFTVSPRLRLLKNKLLIRSKAGIRYNNLRQSKLSTTHRFTGNASVNWQISRSVGLDVNYNKNQIESLHKNDTLRLSNVFNSLSVSPRFTFNGLGGSNILVLTYNYQDVSDKNVYTYETNQNNTHSATCLHSLSFPTTLSLSTTVLFNQTTMADYQSQIMHLSESVSRRFLKNKLSAALSLGANIIRVTTQSAQMVFRINSSYTFGKYGILSFYLTNNNYRGEGVITQNYRELYGSIQYNISF